MNFKKDIQFVCSYSTYDDIYYTYFYNYNIFPCEIYIEEEIRKDDFLISLSKMGIEVKCGVSGIDVVNKEKTYIYTSIDEKLMFKMVECTPLKTFKMIAMYTDPNIDDPLKKYNILKYIERKKEARVKMIASSSGRYFLKNLEINKPHIKREYLNILYGDNFEDHNDKVISFLSSDKSGLINLTGEPGTGKTTYIKYLMGELEDKEFIFISNFLISYLTSPDFVNFLIENLKNCVLIIEDAEDILSSRQTKSNPYISTLLNLTDGIIGDGLKIKIITTQNHSENEDVAIKRKGRMIMSKKFNKVSKENANKISTIYNLNKTFDSDVSLSDIFGDIQIVDEEVNKKIGF